MICALSNGPAAVIASAASALPLARASATSAVTIAATKASSLVASRSSPGTKSASNNEEDVVLQADVEDRLGGARLERDAGVHLLQQAAREHLHVDVRRFAEREL